MDYKELVEVYEDLEKTTKKLGKTYILSRIIKKASEEDLKYLPYLLQGIIFTNYDERELGVSQKLIVKVISTATGIETSRVETFWKEEGDLGKVAERLLKKSKQQTLYQEKLTIKKVFTNLQKLPEFEGKGSQEKKIQLVSELLNNSSPLEAKFIVNTILNQLRVGVAAGLLRDAIVWAFFEKEIKLNYNKEENILDTDKESYKKYIDLVQNAYDLKSDFSQVAIMAKKGIKTLEHTSLEVGKPVNVMLYQKAKDIEDAFNTVGKPAAFEYKFDGFRLCIHKKDNEIILFTRRQENVTKQFPEVIDSVKHNTKGKDFILDAEAVGFDKKTGKYLPFQAISQRIKRKYDIKEISEKYPVELNAFDVLYFNGKSIINEPFRKRRNILETIIPKNIDKKIKIAKQLITSDVKEAENFFKESISKGEEGVMAKNLDAIYKPGSRVGNGVKIKPEVENLDLVITAAEWGTGKRSSWLSSFYVSCRKEDKFLEIGKVSTGGKEKDELGLSFNQLTKLLKPNILEEKGRYVRIKPKIVIEVGYAEIQKSPTYESGFALRFPRIIQLRTMDKLLRDINTLEDVKRLYKKQKR